MCLKAGQTPDCMQVKKWLNLLSPCIWWTSYTETTVTWRVLYKDRSILRKDTKREFELFHRNRNINSKGITFLKTLNRVCYFFFSKTLMHHVFKKISLKNCELHCHIKILPTLYTKPWTTRIVCKKTLFPFSFKFGGIYTLKIYQF